jgi:hypothetical protein
MIGTLRSKLTAANVMAAVAVFLALGGGIAWALANNSVKSRHIKNGQVKFPDLDDAAQPLGFTYLADTGDIVQEQILNTGGYRFTAACENASGEPSLEVFLDFPQAGRLVGHGISDPSDGPPDPFTGNGVAIDPDDPFEITGLTAPEGESVPLWTTLAYVGASKAATINLHAFVDDGDDTCRVNGMLIPGTMAPG